MSVLVVVVGVAVAISGHHAGNSLLLWLGCLAAVGSIAAVIAGRSAYSLGPSEQLKVQRFTDTTVHDGPGIVVLNPFGYRSAEVQPAESLGTLDVVLLRDSVSGQVRVEKGPQQVFLRAYEVVQERSKAITLSKTDYIFVEDTLTGETKTVRGPCVWFKGAHDKPSEVKAAISLKEDEFIRLQDLSTGSRWIIKGKDIVFLESTWRVDSPSGVEKAWTLKSFEYVRLLDSVTGKVAVHRGEKIVFPGPNEQLIDSQKMVALDLCSNQYVKILDQASGDIRTVSGPCQVILGPNDKFITMGPQKAIEIDEQHAALVRDISTGQLRLVTNKQLFVPGPNECVEEVRELVKLEDHEAMIIKDKDGLLHFHYGDASRFAAGNTNPRAFFLQPYYEIVKLAWSGGLRRAKRDLCIERFDCRPQFMWNEIDCRTQDNVELVLETTQFWEVQDLAKLVRSTGNLTGDIFNKLRSQFIKHVSCVTLKLFMSDLHRISREIFEEDVAFFESRGVKIHSLEVTKYTCSERRTSEVLQQIIEETTNRLNRLSQAESENEVKIFKMQGQIEHEKMNSQLLDIQHDHAKKEAAVAGLSEAERVASFIKGLEQDVPSLESRIEMWQVLRKTDALSVVSTGGASLYYTPSDVNLSISSKTSKK